MAILTREDVYNKMVNQEKPVCPHCGQEMVIWECPPERPLPARNGLCGKARQ